MPVLGTQKVSPREGQGSRVGMLSVRRSVLGSRAAGFAWSEGPEGDVATGPGRPAAASRSGALRAVRSSQQSWGALTGGRLTRQLNFRL